MTSILITTNPITYGLNMTSTATTSPPPSHDPSCSNIGNSWAATYNHGRFTEYSPVCVTVKGKDLSVEVPGTKGGEPDGDFHFNILADTLIAMSKNEFRHLLSSYQ